MAQPCTRPLLNNLAKNLWSRYRGKRAGRSTKTKEANRTYKITQVNPRPKDHSKAKINSRGHDPSNCISITTKLQFTSVPEPQARNFVPSLFLSNVMSLAPKIDEVSHVVQNANYDLVCITESWLRQHIPDSVIAINGYNIIRRDRKEATHGGVCMYIKESIPFSVLDFSEVDENPVFDFEVLWAKLRPTRLPRGFSSIISGVIYHPPSAPDSKMQDYLLNCLTSIESQHPNSGILLVGDLNHLNETTLKSNFNLNQIVHFPTRGKSFLGATSEYPATHLHVIE